MTGTTSARIHHHLRSQILGGELVAGERVLGAVARGAAMPDHERLGVVVVTTGDDWAGHAGGEYEREQRDQRATCCVRHGR